MENLTGKTVGRFRVDARLGAGGMGEVYRAYDTKLRRQVALKCLQPALASDDEYRRKLLKEARHAASLNHGSIASVYDVVEEKTDVFVVMECVDGKTLRQTLTGGRLDVGAFVGMAEQCAEALSAAHLQGIVHRDIKPTNIMLTPTGQVKMLDFGVARKLPDPFDATTLETLETETKGRAWGTPIYMAPEALVGNPAGPGSDIFSLGVVFYEALAGKHPFLGRTLARSLDNILHSEPEPLAQINPDVPPELSDVVDRMLTKSPDARFQQASDLVDALRAVREGTAVAKSGRTATFKRAVVAAVLALLVVAVTAWSLWPSGSKIDPGSPLLFAGIDNRTGDKQLDAIDEVFRGQLDQSAYYDLMEQSEIDAVLVRMQRDRNAAFDVQVAREVGWRAGAPVLVAGSVSSMGSGYLLTVRVERVADTPTVAGESWTETFRADGKDSMHEAIDAASDWVRETVGEAAEDVDTLDAPARDATSASWEALDLYQRHLEYSRRGEWANAIALLDQAVEVDPDFARAHARLGDLYNWIDAARAYFHYTRALDLEKQLRLTTKEALEIRAMYLVDTGDPQAALEVFRKWKLTYPQDYTAHYGWAMCQRDLGWEEEAIDSLLETEARWPDSPYTLARLAELYGTVGRHDEALAAVARLRELRGDEPRWDGIAGRLEATLLLIGGEPDLALEVLHPLFESDNAVSRSEAYQLAAAVLAETGRDDEALAMLAEGEAFDEQRAVLEHFRAEKLLSRAYIHFRRDEAGACRDLCLRAAGLTKEPRRLAAAGTLLARSGYPDDAEWLLAQIDPDAEAPIHRIARHRIRGEVDLARGFHDEGLDELRRASALERPSATLEYLARGLEVAGADEEALAVYVEIGRRPGRIFRSPGIWDLEPGVWADSILKAARLADRLGRTDEAIEADNAYRSLRGKTPAVDPATDKKT